MDNSSPSPTVDTHSPSESPSQPPNLQTCSPAPPPSVSPSPPPPSPPAQAEKSPSKKLSLPPLTQEQINEHMKAVNFIVQTKQTVNSELYNKFVQTLMSYHKTNDTAAVIRDCSHLLADNAELLNEFTHFIPDWYKEGKPEPRDDCNASDNGIKEPSMSSSSKTGACLDSAVSSEGDVANGSQKSDPNCTATLNIVDNGGDHQEENADGKTGCGDKDGGEGDKLSTGKCDSTATAAVIGKSTDGSPASDVNDEVAGGVPPLSE